MWSLGVEEQFYLFWPFLISAVLLFRGTHIVFLFMLIIAVSALITHIVTKNYPLAAFYLTPFRIYEFAIGAICVFFDNIDWSKSRYRQWTQHTIFIVGVCLILSAAFYYSGGTSFPGAAA